MEEAASRTPHQGQMRRRNPHFKNFVENTSLHGVKYIFGGNQHWIKRAYWCIVVIGSVISLFAIFRMKINAWKESPMMIESANTPQSISTLPIPALTICGPRRSTTLFSETRDFLEKHYSDEVYKIVDILGMSGEAFDKKFSFSRSTEKYTNKSEKRFVIADSILEQFFHDDSLPGSLSIESAFGNEFLKSSTFMFRGHCLSSNMFPPSKIYRKVVVRHFLRNDSMERDTRKDGWVTDTIYGFPSITENRTSNSPLLLPPKKYPTLMPLGQSHIAYEIKNNYNLFHFEYFFIGKDNSLRFTIHNPWEVPNPFMRWHRLHLSKGSRIHIQPEHIIKYPVDENDFLYKVPYAKQCYNTTEKTLDFFEYYTRQNCLMECSTKRALRECGCVLFFMPHNESTYICSDKYSSCALNVAKATHYDTGERKFVDSCECLPSCNYTDYKMISYELFHKVGRPLPNLLDLLGSLANRKSNQKYNRKRNEIQTIEIVFRDVVFHPKVRTFTYNNYKMMDSTVFYLDAFLGISIMTIAEMFYYILLFAIDYLKRKIQLIIDVLYM